MTNTDREPGDFARKVRSKNYWKWLLYGSVILISFVLELLLLRLLIPNNR